MDYFIIILIDIEDDIMIFDLYSHLKELYFWLAMLANSAAWKSDYMFNVIL